MNSVNQTLYIPLYGKSYVSKKGLFLDDKKAEEIWQKAGLPLRGKSRSKWLAYYMGIRSAVFDQWVSQQMTVSPQASVLHIGCGLDSRVLRVPPTAQMWYDVDFPEVITERRKYFTESENYQMLRADVRNSPWLSSIPKAEQAIVVMEGVSMYLSESELRQLIASLCQHFGKLTLLMDCYTVKAARISRYKNPINDVGVTQVYGMDTPESLENQTFRYVAEHEMTPKNYIDMLSGTEKLIFRNLFAGSFARQLYRLYEYKKA
jgi:O-methyltransferase involved in polyketide biosynthesis